MIRKLVLVIALLALVVVAGAVLLFGSLSALVENVCRSARR